MSRQKWPSAGKATHSVCLKTVQEVQQVMQLLVGEVGFELMAETGKDFGERGSTAIVEVWPALAYAA